MIYESSVFVFIINFVIVLVKTVSEFIINDVIPFMAFCAEIWQQKRLRFPLEVAAFSLYTDDSYLIRYREIDMSCCNIVLSLRTDQS